MPCTHPLNPFSSRARHLDPVSGGGECLAHLPRYQGRVIVDQQQVGHDRSNATRVIESGSRHSRELRHTKEVRRCVGFTPERLASYSQPCQEIQVARKLSSPSPRRCKRSKNRKVGKVLRPSCRHMVRLATSCPLPHGQNTMSRRRPMER